MFTVIAPLTFAIVVFYWLLLDAVESVTPSGAVAISPTGDISRLTPLTKIYKRIINPLKKTMFFSIFLIWNIFLRDNCQHFVL